MIAARPRSTIALPRFSYSLVSKAAGVLLLLAALLKGQQLMLMPPPQSDLWRVAASIVITLELLLALLLVFAVQPRRLRLLAGACFTIFAVVSLFKAVTGESSCGCFGALEVHPWLTFVVDALIALGFAFCEIEGRIPATPSWPLLASYYLLLFLAFSTWVWSTRPARLNEMGVIEGPGNAVVLEPGRWLGNSFPLSDFVTDGNVVMRGDWRILFFRHGCPKCDKLWPQFAAAPPSSAWFHAAIEVPSDYGSPRRARTRIPVFRLTDEYSWYVSTPLVVDLEDGIVTAVQVGDETFARRRQPHAMVSVRAGR